MTIESEVRQAFERQARACERLGSPFTARLCRIIGQRLDRDRVVGKRIMDWRGDLTATGDAVALRLAGALHALVLSGSAPDLKAAYPPNEATDDDLWQACDAAFQTEATFIDQRMDSAPQTNEVRRSSALLPGLLTIASIFDKPLALSELGASAGLNLHCDRYNYRLGDLEWGPQSTVALCPDWEGPPPPHRTISILDRAGCDLNPLDPSSPQDRLRLLSFIWADQFERLDRTAKALDLAAAAGLKVDRADAIDWLKARLAKPRPRLVHVIYHTIAWQYLPEAARKEGDEVIEAAGLAANPDAPIARLQLEADAGSEGAALTLQVWPHGERQEIARADFHGRWVRWKGWPSV